LSKGHPLIELQVHATLLHRRALTPGKSAKRSSKRCVGDTEDSSRAQQTQRNEVEKNLTFFNLGHVWMLSNLP
jgi:hypothetical protein